MVQRGHIMVQPIKDVLISRDGMSEEDALEAVRLAKEHLLQLMSQADSFFEIEDFCQEEFGLEPDYLEELLL